MKKRLCTFMLAAFAGCLTACGQSIPIDMFPDTLTYAEYYNGEPISTAVIHKGDGVYDTLYGILSGNARGWDTDTATYPKAEYFSADRVKINCMDTIITLSYREEDGGWIQLSKKIPGCKSAINRTKMNNKP